MSKWRAETVEAELDKLIEKRAQERQTAGEDNEVLEAAHQRDEERRRQNAAAWGGWHRDQAVRLKRTMSTLVQHHEKRAAELLGGGERQ